jgi:BolA protein
VEIAIRDKLAAAFQPIRHLDVINESHRHNVPHGSETHFKVVIVSDQFAQMPLIDRHRMVNAALSNEIGQGGPVHALSIVAKTPGQWNDMVAAGKTVGSSPNCRGGDGSLSRT